ILLILRRQPTCEWRFLRPGWPHREGGAGRVAMKETGRARYHDGGAARCPVQLELGHSHEMDTMGAGPAERGQPAAERSERQGGLPPPLLRPRLLRDAHL